MKKSARYTFTAVLVAAAALLFVLSLHSSESPSRGGLRLAFEKLNRSAKTKAGRQGANLNTNLSAPSANLPTFGHPIIAGIGGTGFEESIRIDPTNPNRIYTSAPGSASADTSWVWHSLDGGRTFKWVVGAAPFEG